MKQLTLIRHAKSSWAEAGLSDFDRPLNKRGECDAPNMGQRLHKRAMPIDCIISSPAKRAISTAHIIAQTLHFNVANIIEEPRIYEATTGTLLTVVQALEDRFNNVLMFGHNPGVSQFGYYLSGQLQDLPTCAMFAMQFELEHWANMQPNSAEVLFFDYPKNNAPAL